MDILNTLKQLRDDIKTWVTNNLNALNAKIDEKTIPIDSELSSTSTNPVQNKAIKKAIDNIPTFSGDYNDLTNAPDISEDGSGNMIIADKSGNIIFKADADGMHTTAVSINGEAAATEKYVDDAITKIPTPDVSGQINAHNTNGESHADIRQAIEDTKEELSESIVAESNEWKVVDEAGNIIFSVDASGAHTTELTLNGESAATESYVDNAIANIEFPTTDLTDYATKKYVDDAVDGIEIPSLDGYATETYVDNKVADLVNSAPEALNTLGELATALEDHEDAYDALLETVGGKATHTDLENLRTELSESIVTETDEWKVVDEAGNIIFSVDADGAHTTSLTLNGQSVEDMIDDIVVEESDPTVPAWAKQPTKPTYIAEEVGALPDTTPLFSGDYNDLKNAPNITEDESNNLVIADPSGNIIFRSDSDGFETTKLTAEEVVINGVNIGEAINELGCNCDLSNYQTKDDDNLVTTDKTIVGAINEVNEKVITNTGLTVDKITGIETGQDPDNIDYNDDPSSYAPNGIAWDNEFVIKIGDESYSIPSTTRIPLIAGENVTFEIDDTTATGRYYPVVKINAATKECSQGLEFASARTHEWKVSGIGTCTDRDIVIPATYQNDPVTEIADNVFRECSAKSISIPEGITKIGQYAFAGCNLDSIVIPSSITNIAAGAFMYCDCKKVCFKGTMEQWQAISVGADNSDLYNTTILYNYAETIPALNQKIDNLASSGTSNGSGLPPCPTEDGDYILNISNGVATWVAISRAEEAKF